MKQSELDRQLAASHAAKAKSWGKLLSQLRRHFELWATAELEQFGYADFKMTYMPLLMNIGPEGINNNELAKKAMVTKQAMSKVVKELVDAGYVRTETHGRDKRISMLVLTNEGKKLVVSSRSRVAELEADYEALIGKRKFAEIKEGLTKILAWHEEQALT